jgi:hypothetical protein
LRFQLALRGLLEAKPPALKQNWAAAGSARGRRCEQSVYSEKELDRQ